MQPSRLVPLALLAACVVARAEPPAAIPSPATPPPASSPAVTPATPPAAVAAVPVGAVPAPSLPAMGFIGTPATDDLYELLQADLLFKRLNKDLVGSPIVLRITHSLEPTSGGKAAGLASAFWAGGTLGLLPVVTNNDLVVYYELIVNGVVLSTYEYRRNLTRSFNIWSKDTTHGLGADGVAWLKGTLPQFIAAARQDPKLAELVAEHQFYFGTPGS